MEISTIPLITKSTTILSQYFCQKSLASSMAFKKFFELKILRKIWGILKSKWVLIYSGFFLRVNLLWFGMLWFDEFFFIELYILTFVGRNWTKQATYIGKEIESLWSKNQFSIKYKHKWFPIEILRYSTIVIEMIILSDKTRQQKLQIPILANFGLI